MELAAGQVVYSKNGRDKGQPFVVLSYTEGYAELVNGKSRPLSKPKKKKAKHIQPTNTAVDLNAAGGARGLQDADIRKLLKPFITAV